MDQGLWIKYPSSIEQIVEQNESFDSCIIKICYTGRNRNKSSISKRVIESALPSIYNCPIVCNYNVCDDTLGGHDVEVVSTNNGMRLINLTDAIGVVPANCKFYWETLNDNGVEHEYLCVEAILWKRSSAYTKIKRDGIVSQSMEITVKSGRTIDGFYEIEDFIFTAFCLLGDDVEPCFESASLEVFSLQQYKNSFEEMMSEFKEHYSMVSLSRESGNKPENLLKGGNTALDNKLELTSEHEMSANELSGHINTVDDFAAEEVITDFESIENDSSADSSENDNNSNFNEADSGEKEGEDKSDFSLSGEQFVSQLVEALSSVKYADSCWGEIPRYIYVDYDHDCSEVFCYDCEENWKLYGFSYSMNGDNVVVNFDSKKRKKFCIVDFEEGSADFEYNHAFNVYKDTIVSAKNAELSELQNKFNKDCEQHSRTIEDLQSELTVLREYQKTKQTEERKEAEDELFSRFAELNGVEAFEALRSDCSELSFEEIENKCYEIKGRNTMFNFSATKPKSTRLVIEKKYEDEPYGGLFLQYPPK